MLERRTPMKRTAFKRSRPDGPTERVTRAERPMAKASPSTRRAVIAPASDKVTAVPKQPRERCQHLLDMAEGAPCLFWFAAGCRGSDGSTTVKAHDNRLSANKGKGLKAHDWASVDACDPCHSAYDQGNRHTREEKDAAFDAALTRQMQKYRDIVATPLAKPKDREAAQWAIQRYEHHQSKGDLS
jgi:hypothetical protein